MISEVQDTVSEMTTFRQQKSEASHQPGMWLHTMTRKHLHISLRPLHHCLHAIMTKFNLRCEFRQATLP